MDECFVRSMNHTPTNLFLPRENEDDVRHQKTLACEMFTLCFRPWLKNVACLSSLFYHVRGDTAFQQKEMEASSLVSSNWLAVVSFLSFCSHGPYKTVKTKEQEAPKFSLFSSMLRSEDHVRHLSQKFRIWAACDLFGTHEQIYSPSSLLCL